MGGGQNAGKSTVQSADFNRRVSPIVRKHLQGVSDIFSEARALVDREEIEDETPVQKVPIIR